ncbi:peptidoglycan DD-metalloendopeptidase family protein [Aquabacterium sp. OR-4]|nr:peptidoglycan DD-metalloendopeptidase family protein [Aquabacterium sp. OR-4]MDT7836702.1 peptidoglycan DD-metalloendopeptidase family protein [Aquabacterium sp. OR-4]
MSPRFHLLSWSAVALVLALAGCASPRHKAPVEDRGSQARASAPAPGGAAAGTTTAGSAPAAATEGSAKPPPPGIENAGKPGYYTVKPGDTLTRVALEHGQAWREIARWNGVENPNLIEVGQVLRVVPPQVDASAASTRPVSSGQVEARPLDGRAQAGGAAAAAGTASAPATAREGDEDIGFAWPASGPVLGAFEEGRSKGLAIGGKAGDAVLAAADGRVAYAGSGLRGYGNLVIVKHNNTYLTAYAHNQTLLVKEDQVVRRGQKIAEMGASDAERVQLHFEIRRQGKPVDPSKLLPAR